jgi:hypothetical protein
MQQIDIALMGKDVNIGGAEILAPSSKIAVVGRYDGQIIRDGKVVDEWSDENLVVDEGLNSLLDVYLHGSTQLATWYLGLFEGNYTPIATVTAATIASASTECSAYASATRPEWVEAAAAAKSITNSANRASFVFNATKTIYGAFLASNSTKSGTTGVLFSAARFATAKNVESGDELLLTYTFSVSSV